MASGIPLPKETTAASRFVAENDHRRLPEFWGSQLTAIGNLVKTDEPPHARWGEYIDPNIRPAAGKIQILALRHMGELCGLGSSRWLGQCAVGLPITGDLSRWTAFPSKRLKGPLLPTKQLFETAEARFRERPPKSGW